MNDTPTHIVDRYRKLLLARPPAERLEMACRMFQAAVALVEASIRHDRGSPTPEELRREKFLRLYGSEFNEREQSAILERLLSQTKV